MSCIKTISLLKYVGDSCKTRQFTYQLGLLLLLIPYLTWSDLCSFLRR